MRLCISAVAWAAKRQTDDNKSHHSNSLVHIVTYTLDYNISSMNGLKQSHSLTMMVLQLDQSNNGPLELEIRAIYIGPKNPSMPNNDWFQNVPKFLGIATAITAGSVAQSIPNSGRPSQLMSIHQNTLVSPKKMAQEAGQCLKLSRGTMYLPLLYAPMTDPSTMMTALEEEIWLTDQIFQLYNIIRCNQ